MFPALASIVMTLRPRKVNTIPRWQGRAAQALFYSGLHMVHPLIASNIHDSHGPKPFTMSNLMGARPAGDCIELHPNDPLYLRLTTLHPHVTAVSLQGIVKQWCLTGFSLHDQPLRVMHRRVMLSPTYADFLADAPDDEHLTLHFAAPTAFKATTRGYVAQPEPRLIFQNLYHRWNFFAETQLPEALLTAIESNIRLIESTVTEQVIRLARGRRGVIPGFTGSASFALDETSRELRQMLHALVAFAQYAGIGIKTTIGMGQLKPDLSTTEGQGRAYADTAINR